MGRSAALEFRFITFPIITSFRIIKNCAKDTFVIFGAVVI